MYGFIDLMVLMIPMIKHQLEHGRSESLEHVRSTGLDEESELPNIYEVTGMLHPSRFYLFKKVPTVYGKCQVN
jgi:hypothetical protein